MISINISINKQSLILLNSNSVLKKFDISSAKNGIGQNYNSYKTPIGKHIIIEKSGENAPINTSFKNRVAQEIFNNQDISKDWILTRILRLAGLETGLNLGGTVDTYKRMIYLHGTPNLINLNQPSSHGCIRMRNTDIIKLYDLVPIKTLVNIYA